MSVVEFRSPTVVAGNHLTGTDASILSEVYNDDTTLAIWRRDLSNSVEQAAARVLVEKPHLQISSPVVPDEVQAVVGSVIGSKELSAPLCEDIAQMVDMFCCLFDLDRAGLRLSTLDRAMCSRFHVDRVPCRLITTYSGVATEWLPHQQVDRSKLGMGNQGMPDAESGLYKGDENIQKLVAGDVALLKGELWKGNEGAGVVHRSPAMIPDTRRLLLTLDFIDEY